jgi:hypothetical protein
MSKLSARMVVHAVCGGGAKAKAVQYTTKALMQMEMVKTPMRIA